MAKKDDTARTKGSNFFGYQPCLHLGPEASSHKPKADEQKAQILICGHNVEIKELASFLKDAPKWQFSRIEQKTADVVMLAGAKGPVWIVWPQPCSEKGDKKKRAPVGYARYRDLVGQATVEAIRLGISHCELVSLESDQHQQLGAVVGFFMANYSFRTCWPKMRHGLAVVPTAWQHFNQTTIAEGMAVADAVNLARHLVNLPAAVLHPESFASRLKGLLKDASDVMTIDVWDEKKLEKEKMGLMLAVGQAAINKPRLVHIRYRPQRSKRKHAPVALVGKGITFDTGGLDLKPSSGMRLMKKDMGGAATLAGLTLYLAQQRPNIPIDIYFALAENAVAAESYRPGDVLVSRSKKTVEVHNTDAEGRLVLADALTVAQEANGDEAPQFIIDVATLTGAIKVGLGTEVAGLFSNDEQLCARLVAAGNLAGEPVWPMPLHQEYLAYLRSDVADISNAAANRFGGAITAALFLEQFVVNHAWAHLDIYAWQEQPTGAFLESGGSGQAVQLLITALSGNALSMH